MDLAPTNLRPFLLLIGYPPTLLFGKLKKNEIENLCFFIPSYRDIYSNNESNYQKL